MALCLLAQPLDTDRSRGTYRRAVIHNQSAQGPGEAQPQEDVEDIATDGVGHSHVPHAWG